MAYTNTMYYFVMSYPLFVKQMKILSIKTSTNSTTTNNIYTSDSWLVWVDLDK